MENSDTEVNEYVAELMTMFQKEVGMFPNQLIWIEQYNKYPYLLYLAIGMDNNHRPNLDYFDNTPIERFMRGESLPMISSPLSIKGRKRYLSKHNL